MDAFIYLELWQPLDDGGSAQGVENDGALGVCGCIARGQVPVEWVVSHGASDKRRVGQVMQRSQFENLQRV
jgi:hypothetical protein